MKNNLQIIRWQRKMSLRKLAALSGISVSELNKIENNEINNIYYSTACSIAKALNVPVNDIFPW